MKNTHFFSYFLLITGILSMSIGMYSCRKYEDGPAFSLRSKKSRVVNDWQPALISRNDFDILSEVDTFSLSFTDSGNFSWTLKMNTDTASIEIEGNWEFAKVKEAIRLEYESFDSVLLVPGDRLLFMDIRRLKEDEMWVEYLWEGDEYFVQLFPQ